MATYKVSSDNTRVYCLIRNDGWSIPIAPANTDYANFKREINEGTAQLEDADGNLMTAEQAKDFVKELP